MSTPTPPAPSAPSTPEEPGTPEQPSAAAEPSTAQDPGTPPTSSAPPSRYSMGSSANMIRSLIVILGLVAVLVAIVPRVSQVDQPAVDAQAVVQDAVRTSGLPLQAPVGLPSGWKATSATFDKSTDDLLTWQAGWTTASGGFVSIREAKAVTAKWLLVATNGGATTGAVEAGGRTWERRYDDAHNQTSLVDEHEGELTTVVTGTAPDSEILLFANALQRAKSD